MASIHNEFDVELSLQSLFESPTISQMGTQIAVKLDEQALRHAEKRKFSYLVELQCGKGKTPVFFFPGGGGSEPEFFVYAPLVRRVGPEYTFYALRAKGADGVSAPHRSVEEMASAYIEEIQSIQPHGPYRLVGECAGGVTAYETARQLRAKGEPVGLLALMDVMRPTLGKYISFRLFRFPEPLRAEWNYYIVRTKYHWEELRNLPWRDRLAYVLNQAAEILGSDAQPPPANLATTILETETNVAMRRHVLWIRENYRRTVRLHRPQPYEGKIEILVSERLHRRDPTLGWNKLARNGLYIHPLPGDHLTYIRDHTETAAEQLRKCLQLADTESQLRSQSALVS
jgi:thioesterase domain-containing protein